MAFWNPHDQLIFLSFRAFDSSRECISLPIRRNEFILGENGSRKGIAFQEWFNSWFSWSICASSYFSSSYSSSSLFKWFTTFLERLIMETKHLQERRKANEWKSFGNMFNNTPEVTCENSSKVRCSSLAGVLKGFFLTFPCFKESSRSSWRNA